MSDVDEPWWADESPVGVERRRGGQPGAASDSGLHDPDRSDLDRVGRSVEGTRGAGPPYRERPGVDEVGPVDPDVRAGLPYDDGTPGDDPHVPPPEPTRSTVQIFVPAPEDLPPFEEVVGPAYGAPTAAGPDRIPEPGYVPDAVPFGGIPDPSAVVPAAAARPPAGPAVPPAPDLAHAGRPRTGPTPAPRPPRTPIDRRRLATVYDVDGPRVRLGLAWFVVALVATLASPFTTAIVYAVAAGLAARQIVRAWGSVSWQADVAAGLGAVPVLAALIGTPAVVITVALGFVVAIGAAGAPDGSRMAGGGGRVAALGILCLSAVPAVAGATFVLVRVDSVIAASVLLLIASAYEMGDYIVGSGASSPIEGPLAGITTAILVALPMALVLVEPFDAVGVALLGFAAVACPLGQVVGSAVLPGAGAHAPALRRIDTLLLLAPVWAAAAGAF